MAKLVQVSKCTQFKANKAAIIRPRKTFSICQSVLSFKDANNIGTTLSATGTNIVICSAKYTSTYTSSRKLPAKTSSIKIHETSLLKFREYFRPMAHTPSSSASQYQRHPHLHYSYKNFAGCRV